MRIIRLLLLLLFGSLAFLLYKRWTKDTAGSMAPYYQIETIPIPEGIILEVGGMTFTDDDKLGISTRRGEIWLLENPYMEAGEKPVFSRYASGLHEVLGLVSVDTGFLLAQRGELTSVQDTDGDGRAERYKSIYSWPLSGNYHEYSYGPIVKPDGNMLVTLNLSWVARGVSLAKWRGWLLEITPDGQMTPIATGLRSPSGLAINEKGDIFYTENQGDWVGSGRMTHLTKGDFAGNPAGLKWSAEKGSPIDLREEDVPDTGAPLYDVASHIPALKLPAVWFPHGLMGISTSDIIIDTTKGGFGPFAGQMFVGDQGHSKVMRVFLEKVEGEYQGACFPFMDGFSSGVFRLKWGSDRAMFVGMTSRGWSSTGREMFGLQRLRWTGRTPFEMKTIKAEADGFLIEFSKPVNLDSASNPASYEITSFTYHYWQKYGSEVLNQQMCTVDQVVVSADRMSARLTVHGLRKGYIHEIKVQGITSGDDMPLWHNVGYYTLNNVPGGTIRNAMPEHLHVGTKSAPSASAKRVTEMPRSWTNGPERTLTIGTKPGLQFDVAEITVKSGSRIELVFNNNDDMLHNLVITRPGDAVEKVGTLGLEMGLKGPELQYVPATDDVLFHTAVLEPGMKETIYFEAPSSPGIYPFVCTFPGHYKIMRGKLIVR